MKRLTVLCFVMFILMSFGIRSEAQTARTGFVSLGVAESVRVVQEPDIFGFFFIKGKAPQGFADIDHLNLGGSGEYGSGANPPYYGQIRLSSKAATDYALLKPTMNGKNFSFKTKAVQGVSYEFDGAFTRLDFTEDGKEPIGDKSEETILSGTLKKMKAGKMVAEGKVDFKWERGE